MLLHAQHQIVVLALRALRRLVRSRIPGAVPLAMMSVEMLPIGEGRRYSLANALLKDDPVRTGYGGGYSIKALAKCDLDHPVPDKNDYATSIESIARANVLHVLLETNAAVPDLLGDPRFAHITIVVHAFQDRMEDFERLGVSGRCRVESLRERFADISPEAKELQLFARGLSHTVVAAILPTDRDADRRVETLSLGLEDDLVWRLTLLECYRDALVSVGDDEVAMFVGNSNTFVPNGLPLLAGAIDPDRFFIATRHMFYRKAKSFWMKVAAASQGTAQSEITAAGPWSILSRSLAGFKNGAFDTYLEGAQLLGRNLARRLQLNLAQRPTELLLYAPAAKAYVETVEALIAREHAGPANQIALVSCTQGADPGVQEELVGKARRSTRATDMSSFSSLMMWQPSRSERMRVSRCVSDALSSNAVYRGVSAADFILPIAIDFAAGKLGVAVAARAFARALAESGIVRYAISCPGRHWLVRAAADGFTSAENRGPLIDVQALNVLDHPKYLPPIADRATAIDTTSLAIYSQALGFPANAIVITGTPRNDALRDTVGGLDRSAIAQAHGMNSQCRKRILLASQLQPFHRMAAIAEPLAELLSSNPDVELIVKMHPREEGARVAAYRAIFEAAGVAERVVIDAKMTPQDAIAASDVCVTIYSNMAREAAIAGREVVIALFTGWEPPIRLDKEGLAFGATTEDAFVAAITERLELAAHGAREATKPSAASTYFQDNPHLLEGNALKAIDAVIAGAAEDMVPDAADDETADFDILPDGTVGVVIEDGLGLDAIPPIPTEREPVTIHVSKPGSGRGLAPFPSGWHVEVGRFNTDNRALIEAAAVRAESLARTLVDATIDGLDATLLQAPVAELREALWLRLRAPIIEAERNAAILHRGLKERVDTLLVIGRTEAFLSEANALSDDVGHGRRVFYQISSNGLGAFVEPHSAHEKPLSAGSTLTRTSLQREIPDIKRWLSALDTINPVQGDGPLAVVTCAWHLKTVPPTLTPIVRRLPSDIQIVAFNYSNSALRDVEIALREERKGRQLTVFGPAGLNSIVPKRPERAAKALRGVLQESGWRAAARSGASILTMRVVETSMEALARSWLWEMLAWRAACKNLMGDRPAISVACPGRQWHAQIAHDVAEARDVASMTVQNSYMSSGYTYSRPTGSIVTAIDTWSRDLFVDTYNVPPHTITVTSTPRFDYIAALRDLDSATALNELGISEQDAVVLFAAQEGFDYETYEISSALAKLQGADRPCQIFVKVHPRSPDELLASLRNRLDASGSSHNIVVTRDQDIQTLLAAADIVVTIFSNVGIEAAAIGKSLVIAKFGDQELPLPLDHFGIGYVATSPAEVAVAVHRYLTDEEFRNSQTARQAGYFHDNPLMASGGSADAIADMVEAAVLSTKPANGEDHFERT